MTSKALLKELKQQLDTLGISLNQVSKALGGSPNIGSLIFSGHRNLKADELLAIKKLIEDRGGKLEKQPETFDSDDKQLMAKITGALVAACREMDFIPDDKDFQVMLLQMYDSVKAGKAKLSDIGPRADAVISLEAEKAKRSKR